MLCALLQKLAKVVKTAVLTTNNSTVLFSDPNYGKMDGH